MKKKRRANGLKRGPLTSEEKKYLDKNAHKGAEYLAEKIKRKVESVQSYFDSKAPKEEVKNEPPKQKVNERLINTIGVHRKGSGVVVMTPAASQICDEIKQQRKTDQFAKFRMRKDV